MIILGIGFNSDSTAALVRDGEVVAAVSEERLNRIKLWYGVPFKSVETVLQMAGIGLDQVDVVATHGEAPVAPARAPFEDKERTIQASQLSAADKQRQRDSLWHRYEYECKVLGERTPRYLSDVRSLGRPVKVYAHHRCHAGSAYYGSGWDDCLVLTGDGWGEDASSTLWRGNSAHMECLARTDTFDSLGYFYGSITKALGFLPHRHEGKVLGLAAYCRNPKSYDAIRGMIDVDKRTSRFVGRMENGLYVPRFENPALAEFVKGFKRADVAAAAQRSLEEVVCALVADLGEDAERISLAGGIFANVKLNQRIAEQANVANVYVFPHMGDGGLSLGAAWLAHHELTGVRPKPLRSLYLGPASGEAEIGEALARSGFAYERCADIHTAVADLLARGYAVAHCRGRMEFGPRALGHRSILYRADDASVNTWLNERLQRSEFMPFAPATLADAAPDCYVGLDAGREAARFMAMTFDCTARMKAEAPAAVHVDGTARPQVVCPEEHPDFHAILSAYRARTGLSSLINTSFNMHEEPIVCTAADALRAFRESGLPYLALENFLVRGESDVM